MSPRPDDAVVLFPGAIGDFICFLPTLLALRARHTGTLLLVSNPAVHALAQLPDLRTASIDRREVADLFASTPSLQDSTRQLFAGFASAYSWTGFADQAMAARLAAATGGKVHCHRFRGMAPGEHAVDYYARCAGLRAEEPIDRIIADEPDWFRRFMGERHGVFAVIHPGSGSAKKNWRGFNRLIEHCAAERGLDVVVLRGPAEADPVGCGSATVVDELSLPQVATLLRRSQLYIGNDSGISHLAGAVGVPGLVLFGPSDPTTWAPRSPRIRVLHAPAPCPTCGPDVFCEHRLGVEPVLDAMRQLVARSERCGLISTG